MVFPQRNPPDVAGDQGEKVGQASFPSGHTSAAASALLTTAMLLERAAILPPPYATFGAIVLAAGVGETRLLLDEHWASDVLGGGLLGAAMALAALALVARPVCQCGKNGCGMRSHATKPNST